MRQLCRILTAFGALAMGACSVRRPADLAQIADQNVLLVTIDTLRADALGCDGGPARTPIIDALAAEGLRFTFAHAHAVVTLPSHASILTGAYPFQHGVRENSGYRLPAGTETLATRLKAAGFATGAFIGAFPLDARFGLAPGFDVYDGRFDDSGGGVQFLVPERPAPVVVAHATAWIGAQTSRWFAWVHVYDPHAPYRPPPPFDTEYAGRPYYGEVAAVDRALGPLFDAARASPRPTLIVLTGDHGEALGDHGETTHGLFAYESTLRVPLIVAEIAQCAGCQAPVPGTGAWHPVPPDPAPVRHVDIVPTVLDVLGMTVPASLSGHSLRTDADRQGAINRPTYFEAMSGMLDYGTAPLAGVLAGRDKYVSLPIPELYDLARDAGERENLASRAGDRRRVLETRLATFVASIPSAPRREDADVAARLRSLGYTSASAAPKARYGDDDDPKRLVEIERDLHEAVALGEQGRLRDAIDKYRDALEKRPTLTAASRHLAFAYWRVGDTRAAIDTLSAARRFAVTDAGLRVQLGTYLFEAGRTKDAIALLEEAAKAATDIDAPNALGLAYARSSRGNDALTAFNQALQLDPDAATTHEHIGAVHLDAGRVELARAEFERAVRSNPDSAQAHAGLAMTLVKAGKRPQAIDEWKRAVALNPTSFDALYDLGVQLARDGRTAEARPYLEQFARTAPAAQYAQEIQIVHALIARMR